ncbi:MAG: 3'-5' exonuclease [Candidatus Zapsychrus exili]|nr:3'-5' exonuclease [Candidatus Zapsychrus exili]
MKLLKELIVFDLETTGIWVEKDKIVEIAMIKCLPNGERVTYVKRVNPEMPIPRNVSELIGITNEDVKDAPVFKQIAKEIVDFIGDSDFSGFNVERFDLPVLCRELSTAGYNLELKTSRIYDAQKIFHVNEKRDLTAAYKFYCAKDLKNAHSALADTEATLQILSSQLEKYGEDDDLQSLDKFDYKNNIEFFDDSRKFRWWNGKLYMMFGKYAKRYSLEELVKKDQGYLEWILSANFSEEVKDLIEDAIRGKFPKQ